MAMTDDRLRDQLVRILDWDEAHVSFDKAIDDCPNSARGARAPGFEHTIWQLVEHLRIAQADILDFCANAEYVHGLKWPDDYWPKDPAPASAAAWNQSIADFRRDRERMKTLVRTSPDLYALVPTGKGHQTYLRAILLAADHNTYHLGQIVALRRALGAWRSRSVP
jgi:uncharacterized damage-inducible protein DinB